MYILLVAVAKQELRRSNLMSRPIAQPSVPHGGRFVCRVLLVDDQPELARQAARSFITDFNRLLKARQAPSEFDLVICIEPLYPGKSDDGRGFWERIGNRLRCETTSSDPDA